MVCTRGIYTAKLIRALSRAFRVSISWAAIRIQIQRPTLMDWPTLQQLANKWMPISPQPGTPATQYPNSRDILAHIDELNAFLRDLLYVRVSHPRVQSPVTSPSNPCS